MSNPSVRVELITTGSELLLGFTVNTHVNYVARELDKLGFRLQRQTTVADDRIEMRNVLAEALQRADVILVTGGLGPTSDDFTRDVAAELLGRALHRDEAVMAAIRERARWRGFTPPESIFVQALVPAGARVLPNRNGTAPGLAMEHADRLLVLLPGPPRELKPMFEESVRPLLREHCGPQPRTDCRVLKVVGLGESQVEERIAARLKDLPDLELGYCARPGEVEVRIIGPDLAEAEQRIRTALGDHLYGSGDDRLEEVVIRQLGAAGKTLAVAESCTGGLIASRLTNVSGASRVLLNGWVTYSNESKARDLGVRPETLNQHGAVSEETAREMAEGARQRSGAAIAIATTGIAGPTGDTPEKPVGLVYIALAVARGTTVQRHTLTFDRETFKYYASQIALDLVRRELRE